MSKSKRTSSVGLMVSPSKAIFIDTQENHQSRYNNFFQSIGKLPSFEPDDKITKVLYSKFLVKGVTPINSKIMMEKVKGSKQKKQQSTNKVRNIVPFDIKTIVTEQAINHNNFQQIKRQNQQNEKGIFQFSIANRESQKKASRPHTAFQRSLSLGQFNRPQSASYKPNKQTPRPSSVQRSTKKRNRTQTAITRAQSLKNNNRFQYNDQIQAKQNLMTIQDNKSLNFGVNYIQKNKRQASVKKLGTYITSIQTPKQTHQYEKLRRHQKQSSNNELSKDTWRRLTVSDKQKRQIKQKHRKYLNYMRKNMPNQYSQYISFISNQSVQTPLQRSLLSIPLDYDEKFQPTKSQIIQTEIRNFYRDLYNACVDAQYGIKKTMKRQNKVDKTLGILNIYDCIKITKLYDQIKRSRENIKEFINQIDLIKSIVAGLDFFRNLRAQTFNNLFQMDFQIIKVEENQIILTQNSPIQKIYIILNGSVSKKSQDQQQQSEREMKRHKAPQFYSTLFDGQIFGQPNLPLQKTLTYSIRSQQQSLLFAVPYKQYKKALSSNQNIEDRIELLRFIFQANGEVIRLTREDLQILAFQMESKIYSAQQIIIRQGEQFSNLIIVANGKTSVVHETFKQCQKQMSQITVKRKQPSFSLKLSQYRKKNLRKFQSVHETAEYITYYYYEEIQQKIRGHTLNWEGFYERLQQNGKIQSSSFLHYSLMSAHDNTRVYILPPQKFESLPSHIQKSLKQKAQQMKNQIKIKTKSVQQTKKWEKYKNNLVKSILKPNLPNNLVKFNQMSTNKASAHKQNYIWVNKVE